MLNVGRPRLGIGGERRKELCAVERSTETIVEPRKARPPTAPRTEKIAIFLQFGEGAGGNAQIIKNKKNICISKTL